MRGRPMTDREAYPAAWITLAVLAGAFLLWRFVLGEPTVSRCWIWEHWHVYCPGCGGTRAVRALLAGRIGESFLLHPLVPYAAVSAAALLVWYLYCRKKKKTFSQKLWKNVLLVGIVLLCANFLIKNGALLFAHTDLLRRWS